MKSSNSASIILSISTVISSSNKVATAVLVRSVTAVGDIDGASLGDSEGLALGTSVGDFDGAMDAVGLDEGSTDAVGETEGDDDGLLVGELLG